MKRKAGEIKRAPSNIIPLLLLTISWSDFHLEPFHPKPSWTAACDEDVLSYSVFHYVSLYGFGLQVCVCVCDITCG